MCLIFYYFWVLFEMVKDIFVSNKTYFINYKTLSKSSKKIKVQGMILNNLQLLVVCLK